MSTNKMKNQIPNNPRYKGGLLDVSNSTKYQNDGLAVIYRSGLELRFFNLFENSDKYISWYSEPNLQLRYMFNGKQKTYYVDVQFTDSNNVTWLCEIKPFVQTQYPRTNKQSDIDTFNQNIAKWTAAKSYAESNGYRFCILTERFFK